MKDTFVTVDELEELNLDEDDDDGSSVSDNNSSKNLAEIKDEPVIKLGAISPVEKPTKLKATSTKFVPKFKKINSELSTSISWNSSEKHIPDLSLDHHYYR